MSSVHTFNYQDLPNHKVVGLKPADFEMLNEAFSKRWESYLSEYTLEGTKRHRRNSARKNSIFSDSRKALCFILYYVKDRTTQEQAANAFGIDQPKASKYLTLLKKLLHETLLHDRDALSKTKAAWLKNALQKVYSEQ